MKHYVTKMQWSLKTRMLVLILALISIQLMVRAATVTCYDESVGTNGGGSTPTCVGVILGSQCQVYAFGVQQGSQDPNGQYSDPIKCGLQAVITSTWPFVKAESCGQWNIVRTKAADETCCPPSS